MYRRRHDDLSPRLLGGVPTPDHAVFPRHQPQSLVSIRQHGLGAIDPGARSEDCQRGVYLATDPRLCLLMLAMHYINGADAEVPPSTMLQDWVVLVVDDARIREELLEPDPHVEGWDGSYLYRGVIDVAVAAELNVDEIMRDHQAGILPAGSDTAWGRF